MSLSTFAAAAAVAGTIFGGHTTPQYAPFSLRADGRTLTGMMIQVDFDCDDGSSASWSGPATFHAFTPGSVQPGENVFSPARISAAGLFSTTGEAVSRYGTGLVGTVGETLTGTVRRGAASGTYSATLVMREAASGATTATCQSGTIRWKARSAPNRVYAGLTDRGQPLVIERTRDGRKVKVLWISWAAPCPSGGAWEIGEGLSNFPIARTGRFGDRWTDAPRRYTFRGRIRGSRAAGVFGVDVTDVETKGDGASVELCRSPVSRWTARSTRA